MFIAGWEIFGFGKDEKREGGGWQKGWNLGLNEICTKRNLSVAENVVIFLAIKMKT